MGWWNKNVLEIFNVEINVDAQIIGVKKLIIVKATQGAVRNAINAFREITGVQLKQEKMFNEGDNLKPETAMEFFDAQLKLIDTLNDFLIETLRLGKKEQKALQEVSFEELSDFASDVAGQLMCMTETEATEEDLKSVND